MTMINKKLLYGTVALLLIGIGVFFWSNKPIKLPPQISEKCGIESCHGLDISCGSDVADVCTMEYRAGDNCRQYANCQSVNGQCQLVKSQKFDECKSCVEKCTSDFKDDQINFFECESKCR